MPVPRLHPYHDPRGPVIEDEPATTPDGSELLARGSDPVVRSILTALQTALDHQVDPAVAEPLAVALTKRLAGAAEDKHPDPASAPAAATVGRLAPATLMRVVGYMRSRLDRQITLDELAREANLSKYYFSRLFAATVGVTPHRYLTALRMAYGVELLQSGDPPIAVVAVRCGYAGPSRFSAVFRAHFSTTPRRFRAQCCNSAEVPGDGTARLRSTP